MILLSLSNLKTICKNRHPVEFLQEWVDRLNILLPKYSINTRERVAMFLAQYLHESNEFTQLTENLSYSAEGLAKTWPNRFARDGEPNELALLIARNPQAVANEVYANRYGNGDTFSGDGWKYRGRGVSQLTFKDNYKRIGDALGLPLVVNPDLVALPDVALETACMYWQLGNINKWADKLDTRNATKAVNGGFNGLVHREEYLARAMMALK